MSKESDFIKAERCRVLYAYSRQDETELDLQEGDIVIVTQEGAYPDVFDVVVVRY